MTMRRHQSGFTIIELMIATLVFSTVLLLCATGLISIGRMYQKASNSRATQEVARNLIDQIKNDFELTGGKYKAVTGGFCIGDNLYQNSGTVVDDAGAGGMTVSTPLGGCDMGAVPNNPRQLLGRNMRVADPIITATGTPNSINIKVVVVYGDADLLNPAGTGCKGGPGQEYCASSVLETYATKRLSS